MFPALATGANEERADSVVIVGVSPGSDALVTSGTALNRLVLQPLLLHDAVEPGDGGQTTVRRRLRRGAAAATVTAARPVSLADLPLRGFPLRGWKQEHNPRRGCRAPSPLFRR